MRLVNALDEMLVRRGQLPADPMCAYDAQALVDTGSSTSRSAGLEGELTAACSSTACKQAVRRMTQLTSYG
jgi:hypothetical protein